MHEESLCLFNICEHAIEAHTKSLSRRCVSPGKPEHRVWNADPNHFTSEVSVLFYKQGTIVDAFEFYLFENGRQQVTARDIETWVDEHISSVG